MIGAAMLTPTLRSARMMRVCLTWLLALLPLAGLANPAVTPTGTAAVATAPATQESARIPIADFFRVSEFTNAKLSPDGKHVAMLTADKNDHLALSVFNLSTRTAKVLAQYADVDVGQFHWVNNRRLVYDVTERLRAMGERYEGSGLYAINIDGSAATKLVEREYVGNTAYLSPNNYFHSTIRQNDEHNDIWLIRPGKYGTDLVRLDSLTRVSTIEKVRPANSGTWLLDQDNRPRIVRSYNQGKATVWWKNPASAKWQVLYYFMPNDPNAIMPELIGADGRFYVTAPMGKDTRALYRYDLEKNRIEPDPVVTLDGYDFNGHLLFNDSNGKLLGIHYQTDAGGTLWFDSAWQAIQKKVDDRLPGQINLITPGNENSDSVLVHSYSDVNPGAIYLFDKKSAQLTLLGEARSWIKPGQMAPMDFVKYKARDGLMIPAYLTLPKGKKKHLPLIVLVHGGPYVRGQYWGWDPQVQFLASRGYAVLQPEFRGSAGYGYRHQQLGWKQWGLSMQDDITDGTKWLIEQGIADPQRICLAGGSYGGYAAMWGLIKEPKLYQCGISWIGVTDIRFLYSLNPDELSDYAEKFYLPEKVGDPKTDAIQLKETSVVENAARLKKPVMLAYGGADRTVPAAHGKRLKFELLGSNPDMEWIIYPQEGHGWRRLQTNLDFWGRVENFLAKHIAPPAATANPLPAAAARPEDTKLSTGSADQTTARPAPESKPVPAP